MANRTRENKQGLQVDKRIYNRKDFDKNLVIDERTQAVARKVTELLSQSCQDF